MYKTLKKEIRCYSKTEGCGQYNTEHSWLRYIEEMFIVHNVDGIWWIV